MGVGKNLVLGISVGSNKYLNSNMTVQKSALEDDILIAYFSFQIIFITFYRKSLVASHIFFFFKGIIA